MRTLLVVVPLLTVMLAGCLSADSNDPEVDFSAVGKIGPDGRSTVTGTIDDSHINGGPRGFLPDQVTGMEYVGLANATNTKGIWLNDDRAYLSGNQGLRVIDISDPSNPKLLMSEIPGTEAGDSRDVDFMLHPNGRSYAVMALGSQVAMVDVTYPESAAIVAGVTIPAGLRGNGSSHNIAVVPNSTIVYSSRSISTHGVGTGDGSPTTGEIDVIDFSDPMNPVAKVFAFPATIQDPLGAPKPIAATTCHDITFAIERNLAFCPGISETQIWDVSDAWNPEIIQVIQWPGVQIHHGAFPAREGNLLIIGDEFAGAAGPFPVCAGAENPYATLWFFDITNLATPVPAGYFNVEYNSLMEEDDRLCTTHFGTVVEDRDLMVMGWYSAGSVLIDFSNLLQPTQVAHYRPDGAVNTWEARYYKGHVYTGDSSRGMDILKVV